MVCEVTLACVFFLLIATFPGHCAEIDDSLAKCAEIKDDNVARLQCFDELAGREKPVTEKDMATAAVLPPAGNVSPKQAHLSVMTRHWDLDKENRKGTLVLRPYRPNYFLPVAYNSSPNGDTSLDFDPNAKAQYNEAKFQISFKAKAWEDVLGDTLKDVFAKDTGITGVDVWLAYTQLSFWQLYNSAFSSPFRETNYEPELLINFRTKYELFGFQGRFFNVGFNHQSNGRSKPLSRSWNRIVANIGLERDNLGLQLRTWYRVPDDENNDDNPDLIRYMGYGELLGTFYWKKHRFAVMLRNNFRQENLGAVQLDWSIPLSLIHERFGDRFSFYIQYFNGYGESLLDYNKSINRISAGFMIADWN
jgi:phospholipase A1